MRKLVLGVAALCLSGMTAMAADDPIAVRKHIMASVGAAAGLSGGMMKGEVAYSPAAGKSAIATMAAAASSFGSFFPEGSDKDGPADLEAFKAAMGPVMGNKV